MFPDAMQDNYVKSFCSKKSKTNSSNQNPSNEERSVFNTIPAYVSTMEYSSESRRRKVYHGDEYFQDRPDKTSLGVSHLRSTNSEPPIPSSHMYAIGRSQSMVNSEPLKTRYSRRDNNQPFYHNDIISQKSHQNNDLTDSSNRTIMQPESRCKSDNCQSTNSNQHQHHQSQCHSAPHISRTQHCNTRTAQSLQSHLNQRRPFLENHNFRNKSWSSFDDDSTIPSQEMIENNVPLNEGISVPNSIKVTGDMNSSRIPSYYKHQLPPSDRTTPLSMRSTHKLNTNNSHSSLSASSTNKMNVESGNTLTKKQIMDMNMNIPCFQVIGSSQGTETTGTCTSIGSTNFSESDKYLHYRSPDYDSTTSHQQQINPISTQYLTCQPQYSTSIKTPTSSNTSISKSECRGTNQSRLQILQEIGMAMEMRQKAKVSQETGDYAFWMNHIEKLNKELEKMKFEHTRHSDTSDNPKSKELNLHGDEPTSELIIKETKSLRKSKPISILRNGQNKTRTIKIRAPTDLSADHIFTVNVKGEEITATVVSTILTEYLLSILHFVQLFQTFSVSFFSPAFRRSFKG